jgi:hypothetical protein
VNDSQENPLRASRVQFVSYGLASLGLASGIGTHLVFKRHYAPYEFTSLNLLWTSIPFLLASASAYAVRHFRMLLIAVAVVTALLVLSNLRYAGIIDDDDQPFFLLGFLPAIQIFVAIAFLAPVLAAALFFHQRRAR